MRIFCAVRHSHDPGQFYGELWSANFYPALRQLGHEVVESQVDLLPASRFMDVGTAFTPEERAVRDEITERIVDEVRTAHAARPIGLFLSYFYTAHFNPAGFEEIRRLGIPSVNFYCNSIHQFPLVAGIAAAPDFAWHAEKNASEKYLAVGAKPVWVQMAADPTVYQPVDAGCRERRACFVGMRYADRDRWMDALVSEGLPVALYGHGWTRTQECAPRPSEITTDPAAAEVYLGRRRLRPGSLGSYAALVRENLRMDGLVAGLWTTLRQTRDRLAGRGKGGSLAAHALGSIRPGEIAKTFSRYEVILNFSNVWKDNRPGTRLIPHVRLRDFEGPMCRACYITGYTDEISEFYEIGTEIDTYRTREEFVDKVRFYLANGDAAERLRERGYRRAIRDHKWTNRFEELFRKIGLEAPSSRGSNHG